MQLSNSPGKLVLPFASSGNKNAIPVNSQIGITPGAASLADGFPPLTMTPVAAGGVPPSGLDMNGILYEMSAIVRWANAGGGYPYDADFATSDDVAGYPKGARVLRADGSGYWFNTVDNNETDPDSGAAVGWVPDFTSGAATVPMASANVTLTPVQYGKPIIIITGALTANLNLIFPEIVAQWVVINLTTGPFNVFAKTTSSVGILIFRKFNSFVSDGTVLYSNAPPIATFRQFGAIGDGVADDSQNIKFAIESGFSRFDGEGLTYKFDSNIICDSDNVIISNAKFDASGILTGRALITFSGSQSAGVGLTADTLAGSNVIVVTDTSNFSVDGYVYLSSNANFHAGTSVKLGQIVKVKTINSPTSLTVFDDVLYNFTVADSAVISNLNLKENITVNEVVCYGANVLPGPGTQGAFHFDKCLNVNLNNVSTEYFDRYSIWLDRCINANVNGCSLKHSRASIDLMYGVVVGNGCYGVSVNDTYGEDLRHLVTVGDNDGVNLFIRVSGCHSAYAKESGVDAHPACDFMIIDGNTVELVGGIVADGIIFQGLNCVISNNIVVGNIVSGIRCQVLPDIGEASCVIDGNSVNNFGGTASTDAVIVIEAASVVPIKNATISNNKGNGTIDQLINVHANLGNISGVSISGNVMSDIALNFACYVHAKTGKTIDGLSVSGNVFKSSAASNVYLLGSDADSVINGVICGNVILGGTNGIRLINAKNVIETGNRNSGTTRKVFIDTGSKEITLDRRTSTVVTYSASPTYTVVDQDEFVNINRAGTVALVLPSAENFPGRQLSVKTMQAQLVNSNSSDVVPITGGAASTAILPATAGSWALLKSDGTNWQIMQRG